MSGKCKSNNTCESTDGSVIQCTENSDCCPEGTYGGDCQFTNKCQNDIECLNGGTCKKTTGKCTCPTYSNGWPKFAGPLCQTKVCLDNCNRQGDCQDGKCICYTGWSGQKCDTPITKTCKSGGKDNLVCNGNGYCKNGYCKCAPGWQGLACADVKTVKECPNNCGLNGTCDETTGKCNCNVAASGDSCSINNTKQLQPATSNGLSIFDYFTSILYIMAILFIIYVIVKIAMGD